MRWFRALIWIGMVATGILLFMPGLNEKSNDDSSALFSIPSYPGDDNDFWRYRYPNDSLGGKGFYDSTFRKGYPHLDSSALAYNDYLVLPNRDQYAFLFNDFDVRSRNYTYPYRQQTSYATIAASLNKDQITPIQIVFVLFYTLVLIYQANNEMNRQQRLPLNNVLRFNIPVAVIAGIADLADNYFYGEFVFFQFHLTVNKIKYMLIIWSILVLIFSIITRKVSSARQTKASRQRAANRLAVVIANDDDPGPDADQPWRRA